MYYCEHCRRILRQESCPICGAKKIRPPRPEDLCYLTVQKQVWAGMLENLLKQQGIFCILRPVLGAALAFSVGQGLERYEFFVFYQDLSAAKELIEEVFPNQ